MGRSISQGGEGCQRDPQGSRLALRNPVAFCHLLCHLPTFSSFTHSLLSLSLIKTDRLFSAGKICFLLDFHYELSAFFFFLFPPGGLLPAPSCKHVFYFFSPARSQVLDSGERARGFLPALTRMPRPRGPGGCSRVRCNPRGARRVRLTRQAGFYTLL